jgi:hypothetical protein
MAWKNSVRRLANISRRKVLATTLMYAISLIVHSTSTAGEGTEIPTHSAQRTNLMTSVMTRDSAEIFYKGCDPRTAQLIVCYRRGPLISGGGPPLVLLRSRDREPHRAGRDHQRMEWTRDLLPLGAAGQSKSHRRANLTPQSPARRST